MLNRNEIILKCRWTNKNYSQIEEKKIKSYQVCKYVNEL